MFGGQISRIYSRVVEVKYSMQNTLEQQVVNVANEVLTLEQRENLMDASFTDDLSLSSLERMTLFIALEDEFEREIAQEEIEHIDSLREVIEYIEKKLES